LFAVHRSTSSSSAWVKGGLAWEDQSDALKIGRAATAAHEGVGRATLTLEVFNHFEHMLPRARVHLGTLIEDPVHRRPADPTGFGDSIDGKGKLHLLAQVVDRIVSGEPVLSDFLPVGEETDDSNPGMGKAMGGKGNLDILIGELSDEPAHGSTEGIKQVVKEQFPHINVTREQTGHWKREQGKTIMEDWLASGQEIDGVAANNDEMALGALQAIKAAGKLGKIPVGGTDGTHDALVSMDKGELNNTVYQDPVAQGEEAVNAAYLLAKHEPNPKVVDGNIWIPYQKITKENYKSFMK
jgi:hypothetical protein